MKKILILSLLAPLLCAGCGRNAVTRSDRRLAETILQDTLLSTVEAMAFNVVKGGFTAGDGYSEVWIRDYNTFVELAMEVMPDSLVQDNLLTFFRFQGDTGDIPDGFIDIRRAVDKEDGYKYRYSHLERRFAAHKNTVETDQESSLVQAVCKYVAKSGNRDFLHQKIDGRTVVQRMEQAMEFLLAERYDSVYGLLWGATTADWGDVQPEHYWGVELDSNSHLCIDIYDNAFFVVALNYFLEVIDDESAREYWKKVAESIKSNVRTHLWDKERQKYIPHIYLDESPFPDEFDENAIYYHGGTATAIEAGFLTKGEIAAANARMLENVRASGAQTIGLTLYPPYPAGYFMNEGMYPYGYQNGGDWGWFGGRMISQLVVNGFPREAYEEALPMFSRVVNNNGFYEWYALDGTPSGSGTFRGEAGVLYRAIRDLRIWAQNVVDNYPGKGRNP